MQYLIIQFVFIVSAAYAVVVTRQLAMFALTSTNVASDLLHANSSVRTPRVPTSVSVELAMRWTKMGPTVEMWMNVNVEHILVNRSVAILRDLTSVLVKMDMKRGVMRVLVSFCLLHLFCKLFYTFFNFLSFLSPKM